MKIQNKSVSILNRNNQKIYGILSSPSPHGEYSNPAGIIIFCQAGVASKSGVGNQFKLMCDKLAEKNYVLRFDQSGTGESQGFLADNIPMNDYFLKIMKGGGVEDTIDVLMWAREQHPDKKIILMGQCGGCLTAAYAASKCQYGIDAFIMIAPPTLFLPESNNSQQGVRGFEAIQLSKMYLKKTLSFKSYKKLITGQSDIKLIYQSLFTALANHIKTIPLLQQNTFLKKRHEKFNWQFWTFFQGAIKHKKPMLFLLPELDNETYDFNMEFKPLIPRSALQIVNMEYLPNTDHSLMFEDGRLLLDQILEDWLRSII